MGKVHSDGERETTPFKPVSPYELLKYLDITYQIIIKKHIISLLSNGILFNHESPLRGSNFVTNKVLKQLLKIKKVFKQKLELGNMDSYRDWGH